MKTVDGQENPFNTILSSRFYEVQKYLTLTNHVYSPWVVVVSKKWWDKLSNVEKKALADAARISRDFERQDKREEATKALAKLKDKGMQISDLSTGKLARMRGKLTRTYALIGSSIGMNLWIETQVELMKIRTKR